MYERPLHMKELFDAVALFERTAFASQETQHTEAIVLSSPHDTESLLPLDRLGRPYLISFIEWDSRYLLWEDTTYHATRLVKQYHERSGHYPIEIVLPAQRYFVRRAERFYPFDRSVQPIPFLYEDAMATYEILVRGKV